MSPDRRRCARRATALAVVLGALTGCAGPAPSPADAPSGTQTGPAAAATAGPDRLVDLAVRDFALRPTGEPCAAARPYLDLHPTQAFVVTDTDGITVAQGELPQGRSIKATDIDFGDAAREPTFCVFSLHLPGLVDGSYVLSAGEGRSIPFALPGPDDGPVPVTFPPIAPGGSDPFGRTVDAPRQDAPETREP